MYKEALGYIRDAIELLLLWRIWLDGRAILAVEKASHNLYIKYFEERQIERAAKLQQLAKAREAKASKSIETGVEQLKKLTEQNLAKIKTGDLK